MRHCAAKPRNAGLYRAKTAGVKGFSHKIIHAMMVEATAIAKALGVSHAIDVDKRIAGALRYPGASGDRECALLSRPKHFPSGAVRRKGQPRRGNLMSSI